MSPGGASRSSAISSNAKRAADFSATRCFTIAIDEPSSEKDTGASGSSREASVIREAAPLSPSATTAAEKGNKKKKKKYQKRTGRSRKAQKALLKGDDAVDDSEKQQNQHPLVGGISNSSIVSGYANGSVKRQFFWRNIVKQFNFTNEHERKLLISLTHGIQWMKIKTLPKAFMQRHREIFYLISTPDYQRSGMIQRDVTRTFSIFERSYLPDKDIGAQQGSLFRVLNAISEAEDGYCQGMNFIAALFLVEGLEEADAYALFLYLLKKRHLARIYQRSSTFLDDYLEHFNLMFQRELPDLHHHLLAQGFVIPMYGIEWFTTLFSLSTKTDLACAIFDLFFVGVQDIFLRIGLAILKLLESKLMCMTFEDFLKEFKPLVRQIDPYQAILMALSFRANPLVRDEDTTAHISRAHFLLSTHQNESSGQPSPPKTFDRHRTLPPQLAGAIIGNNFKDVFQYWQELISNRPCPEHCLVLANEILHYAIWYGRTSIAYFAIERCGADVNNVDDTNLTPLHFSVIQNQPDATRLLLCHGADESIIGGRWNGSFEGLTPLETAHNWRFRDTTAAGLVLEREVCLFCNTKIDKLAFGKETCSQCLFTYCNRPFADCIGKHQCPHAFGELRQQRSVSDGEASSIDSETSAKNSTEENGLMENSYRFRNSSGAMTATTVGSSRRSSLSGSTSEVQVPSEATDATSGACRHFEKEFENEPNNKEEEKPGFFEQFVDLFSSIKGDSVQQEHNNLEVADDTEKVRIALEFPDRPEWYCNSSSCHAVFAFFTQGLECSCCGGFFCNDDFQTKTKRCLRCERDL
ncbi:hypothetical protein Gpo141_00010339 [Globisporangium polare]